MRKKMKSGKKRIEIGALKPVEKTTDETPANNTNLSQIGFEQSELGGAKQRFKNNISAIKLSNTLISEKREATDEERKSPCKIRRMGRLWHKRSTNIIPLGKTSIEN
ncbi:MAG: hypothetical protein L6V85_08325 [Clostridiales bacterium]|nr:MAG: hypothetical protein L6V85_08325 [Clostridiales bacterium]